MAMKAHVGKLVGAWFRVGSKMHRHLIQKAIALAILVTPAQAQTTNCQWIGQIWTCNLTQPTTPQSAAPHNYNVQSPQAAFENSFNVGQQIAARRAQKQQERNRELADSYVKAQSEITQMRIERDEALRKEVGKLLAADDCLGAKSLALSAGDLALANQVRTYCQAP